MLEDLVLPRLPQPVVGGKGTDLSKLATAVSIGTGFLFERCLVPYLQAKFPTYTIVEQPKLQWREFQGTADFLLHNPTTKHALIIDAKAFRSDTLREIKERKLTDNWSYPTQLALYHVACQEQMSDYEVDAFWYVWSVSKAKLFVVEQEYDKSERLAEKADSRVECYKAINILLERQQYAAAAELATNRSNECLLDKGYFFGNLCASTKFHYNPYADLFYPEQDPDSEDYGLSLAGEPLTLLVERLMHDAFEANADHTYYRQYLLDKGYTLS